MPRSEPGANLGESTAASVLQMLLERLMRTEGVRSGAPSAVTIVSADSPIFARVGEELEAQTPMPLKAERVFGPLSLRRAFNRAFEGGSSQDGERVLLVEDAEAVPLDVLRNARLQRVVQVRIEDVVAGITGQPCAPLESDLEERVLANLEAFAGIAGQQTFEGNIRPADVRDMLASIEMALPDDLGRMGASKLLAHWLEAQPDQLAEWHLERLRETLGPNGALVGRAVRGDLLAELVETGLLLPEDRSGVDTVAIFETVTSEVGTAELFEREIDSELVSRVRSLVSNAADDWCEGGRELTALPGWSAADKRWSRLDAKVEEATCYPKLRAPVEHEVHAAAEGSRNPTDEALSRWNDSHFNELKKMPFIDHRNVETLKRVWRVRRFLDAADRGLVGTEEEAADADPTAWALSAAEHVSWADRCLRALRRLAPAQDGEDALADACRVAIEELVEYRDELNRRFGESIVDAWEDVATSHEGFTGEGRDGEASVSAARITDTYVAPLLEAGEKVLLCVLDGCDLSTFSEIVQAVGEATASSVEDRFRRKGRLGIGAPTVGSEDGLHEFENLGRLSPIRPAFSLLPSVTEHSRRAIFAGRIPETPGLSPADEEANLSNDRNALDDNQWVGEYPHELFLKGALKDGADELVDALATSGEGPHLTAGVFNFVDDALASHETTAMPEWAAERVNQTGLPRILLEAVAHDYHIVLTADHGHTPYLDSERSLETSGGPARFHEGEDPPSEEWLTVDDDYVPGDEPIHVAWRMGEYRGGVNHRGYHGGVSIEEMVVPLAYLGVVKEPSNWKPDWWSSRAETHSTRRRSPRLLRVSEPTGRGFVSRLESLGLGLSELQRKGAMELAEHGQLKLEDLAQKLGQPTFTVRPAMEKLRTLLRQTDFEDAIDVEDATETGGLIYKLATR